MPQSSPGLMKKLCPHCGRRNTLLSVRCTYCFYPFRFRKVVWVAAVLICLVSVLFILLVMFKG